MVVKLVNVFEEEMMCVENFVEVFMDLCCCVQDGGEFFDSLIVFVFVLICEVGCCFIGKCYYDIQFIGGVVLYQGCIVEMCIGEGKMLVVMLVFVFNVLEGKGCYFVMVNDYFVCVGMEEMGLFYCMFGLMVGFVNCEFLFVEKQVVYVCDIIYVINFEFGFDYLCDNMVQLKEVLVLCVDMLLYYVIVDEVDLILIDEVCILLIILGVVEKVIDLYYVFVKFICCL